jgi:hypothetical protein
VISASDFKKLGVEDQKQVSWNPENRHIAELSDAAAQALMDLEPGDWELVDGDEGDGTSPSSSGSGGEDVETTASSSGSNPSGARARRSS